MYSNTRSSGAQSPGVFSCQFSSTVHTKPQHSTASAQAGRTGRRSTVMTTSGANDAPRACQANSTRVKIASGANRAIPVAPAVMAATTM